MAEFDEIDDEFGFDEAFFEQVDQLVSRAGAAAASQRAQGGAAAAAGNPAARTASVAAHNKPSTSHSSGLSHSHYAGPSHAQSPARHHGNGYPLPGAPAAPSTSTVQTPHRTPKRPPERDAEFPLLDVFLSGPVQPQHPPPPAATSTAAGHTVDTGSGQADAPPALANAAQRSVEAAELDQLRKELGQLKRAVATKEEALAGREREVGELRSKLAATLGAKRASGLPSELQQDNEQLRSLLSFRDEEVKRLKSVERAAASRAAQLEAELAARDEAAAAAARSGPGAGGRGREPPQTPQTYQTPHRTPGAPSSSTSITPRSGRPPRSDERPAPRRLGGGGESAAAAAAAAAAGDSTSRCTHLFPRLLAEVGDSFYALMAPPLDGGDSADRAVDSLPLPSPLRLELQERAMAVATQTLEPEHLWVPLEAVMRKLGRPDAPAAPMPPAARRLAVHTLRVMTSLARHRPDCVAAAAAAAAAPAPTPPDSALRSLPGTRSGRLWAAGDAAQVRTQLERINGPSGTGAGAWLADAEGSNGGAQQLGSSTHSLAALLAHLVQGERGAGGGARHGGGGVAGAEGESVAVEAVTLLQVVAASLSLARRHPLLWLLDSAVFGAEVAGSAGTHAAKDAASYLGPCMQLLALLLSCQEAWAWLDSDSGQGLLRRMVGWATGELGGAGAGEEGAALGAARALHVAARGNRGAMARVLMTDGRLLHLVRRVDAALAPDAAATAAGRGGEQGVQCAVELLSVLHTLMGADNGGDGPEGEEVAAALSTTPAAVRLCMSVVIHARYHPEHAQLQALVAETLAANVTPPPD